MRKHKILITTLLILSLAVAFAGCGSAGADADEGPAMTFETTDLAGEPVSSEDLFAENKITMVNFWASYCGPCIQEMPELEAISKEYAGKGAAVVGVVGDVPVGYDEYLADAEAVIKETGVTYKNIRSWEGFAEEIELIGVPTTFFVNSKGNIVGDEIVGADVEAYRTRLDEYLAR